jgi:arylsulfatase A-like enzyme
MRFPRRLLAAALATLAMLPAAAGGVAADPATIPARPNIVVFYLDDVALHDARLWNDQSRTPNIYEQFIAHGINLDHAIGETPLCCPSRANTLTGLHTHNTRVIANNALLFDPSEHIGKALMDSGYASMYIGKYLNRDSDLTPEQWAQHDAGWTVLDAIKGINGTFYNYTLHTKDQGDLRLLGYHSTQMVADRAVGRFRSKPADQPIFAMLSMFDLHGPNTPQAQDIGSPLCAGMPPWNPPNYNEADVSDKPPAIQALPVQPYPDGWPMVTYCEEMLGVDRAVGQVVNELAYEGRLDNTLLVFTADNGMAWGQHRLGQQKQWPYATPLPLYMRWPAAHWGDTPQTISEIVSDIDYAPTFCELADTCELGPFSRGSTSADGRSLVSLLNGDATDVGRDAVLEESYSSGSNSWSGLRTTELFDPAARWHYIEYVNGFRELYDSINDPWELNNLASDPAHADLIATLHTRLAQLRLEGIAAGTGTVVMREDALPDSGADYQFSGDLGSFVLDDDGGTDATYPSEQWFADIPSGEYTIYRPAVAPWSFGGVTCDGTFTSFNPEGRLTLWLHPTETITCTWVDALRQPDAMVAKRKRGLYKADNIYSTTPITEQTVVRKRLLVGRVYDYYVRLQNDSLARDTLNVQATVIGPTTTVLTTFLLGTTDISADIISGEYQVSLKPGSRQTFHVRVYIGPGTPPKTIYSILFTVSSSTDPSHYDVAQILAITHK